MGSELEDKRTSLLGLLGEELNSREVHCDNVVWVVCMRVRQMCGTCAKEREEKVRARRGSFYTFFDKADLGSGWIPTSTMYQLEVCGC